MTTKVTVDIKYDPSLLQSTKEVQQKARDYYEFSKEQKRLQAEEQAGIQRQRAQAAAAEKDRAIRDEEDREKRKQPKGSGMGHWIFRDYTYKPFCSEYLDGVEFQEGPDRAQVSVGSGDGRSWATHVMEGNYSKPQFCSETPDNVQYFVGYLHRVNYYTGSFGTVYTLPEGATVVEYDPAYYLGPPGPPSGTCPNNFCWPLFFPDELNSGEGRSRKMVPIGIKSQAVNGTEQRGWNTFYVGLPVNDRTSVMLFKTNLHYSCNTSETWSCPSPYQIVIDPEDNTKRNVITTVYYKYPGGNETGWQPVTGYYWIMDPDDDEKILNTAELFDIFPYSTSTVINNEYSAEVYGFVVGSKKARKLENLSQDLVDLVNKRAPDMVLDTYFPNSPRWEYPMQNYYEGLVGPEDVVLGYWGIPFQPDVKWSANPDAQCWGWAKGAFNFYPNLDARWYPYDFYINLALRNYDLPIHFMQGITPGVIEYINRGMNDLRMYDHYGRGAWYDYNYGGDYEWPIVGPVKVDIPGRRLMMPNAAPGSLFDWLQHYKASSLADYYIDQAKLSWVWLPIADQGAAIEEYIKTTFGNSYNMGFGINYNDPRYFPLMQEMRDILYNMPQGKKEFKFLQYTNQEELEKGLRWVSEGDCASWTLADTPPFNYDSDPYYDFPLLTDIRDQCNSYKYKIKLASSYVWPPSVSAKIDQPFSPFSDSPPAGKENHPIFLGKPFMHMVVNTAWGNDYSEFLVNLGFRPEDLTP